MKTVIHKTDQDGVFMYYIRVVAMYMCSNIVLHPNQFVQSVCVCVCVCVCAPCI